MEKLTKKQLKEMEELQQAQRRLKREMVQSIESYWKDIAAMERVAKLTGNKDILLNGDLIKEEKEKLFANYTVLQGLTKAQLVLLRTMVNNDKERSAFLREDKYSQMKELLPDTAVWMRDLVWSEEELLEQIDLLKRMGMNKIYFTDKSTAALQELVWFTRAGAKVEGITNISEYNEGLIIKL